jgi:uncharacterized membrane protein YebE (DUF533 family)
METPGIKNIGLGLLWLLGGGFFTLITFSAASGGGTYVVAVGAIVGGALQFLVGLVQYLGYASQNRADRRMPGASPELKALVRALVATAKADGEIADSEMKLIVDVVRKVTGNQIGSLTIRDICREAAREKVAITTYLSGQARRFDSDMQAMLIRCSFLVMSADGRLDEKEFDLLLQMAKAMGMPEPAYQAVLGEMIAPLIPDQDQQAEEARG